MSQEALCPRCGGHFHCGANDPTPCPCGRFTLTPETTHMLREAYKTCVCPACLAQLQTAATGADATLKPT